MQLFGYKHSRPPEPGEPVEPLAEVTLCATSAELRLIAQFLLDAARDMDAMGAAYSHEHLSDKQKGFDDSPHLVIFGSPPNTY